MRKSFRSTVDVDEEDDDQAWELGRWDCWWRRRGRWWHRTTMFNLQWTLILCDYVLILGRAWNVEGEKEERWVFETYKLVSISLAVYYSSFHIYLCHGTCTFWSKDHQFLWNKLSISWSSSNLTLGISWTPEPHLFMLLQIFTVINSKEGYLTVESPE